jgi:hypothetical protein
MSQLPTRECQYERRVSDLSDRGAKSVRSLNPQQDVPMPLKGEDILMASSIQAETPKTWCSRCATLA